MLTEDDGDRLRIGNILLTIRGCADEDKAARRFEALNDGIREEYSDLAWLTTERRYIEALDGKTTIHASLHVDMDDYESSEVDSRPLHDGIESPAWQVALQVITDIGFYADGVRFFAVQSFWIIQH